MITFFYIDAGRILETTGEDFALAHRRETTTPRGVGPVTDYTAAFVIAPADAEGGEYIRRDTIWTDAWAGAREWIDARLDTQGDEVVLPCFVVFSWQRDGQMTGRRWFRTEDEARACCEAQWLDEARDDDMAPTLFTSRAEAQIDLADVD